MPDASLIIKNIDNEKLSIGHLLTIKLSGDFVIKLDMKTTTAGEILKYLGGPLTYIGIQVATNKDDGTITIHFDAESTNYANLLSSEGVVVDCGSGDISLRLYFDVTQL